ncbi:MAG: hypothetical protein H6Q61_797 [Firmicutes bacterium]|nr:hypothetical protein [Bacillota bacterium]
MDMMTSVASMSMDIAAVKLQQGIQFSVAKKAMETQDIALKAMTEMMPPLQQGTGTYIDTYA